MLRLLHSPAHFFICGAHAFLSVPPIVEAVSPHGYGVTNPERPVENSISLREKGPHLKDVLPKSKVVRRVTPCAPLRFSKWQRFLDFTVSIT